MKLPFFIATKFLYAARRSMRLSIFSLVSILGIALSVMLFLLIDSVIQGLSTQLKQTLIGFDAPISIELKYDEVAPTVKDLQKMAAKHDFTAIPMQQFDGLLEVPAQGMFGVRVRSVTEDYMKIKQHEFEIFWLEAYDEKDFANDKEAILLGQDLFSTLSLMGDEPPSVILTHPYADLGPSGELEPKQKVFKVVGIFSTGRVDFDQKFALMPTPAMASLASPVFFQHEIFLFPKSFESIKAIQSDWKRATPVMKSWFDKNQSLLKAMELEKVMFMIVFVFLVLISGFNLLGVVTIFSLSKMQDAAILRSMGFTRAKVTAVFMSIGMVMGLVGVVLGELFAWLVSYCLKNGGFKLPEAYGFSVLPMQYDYHIYALLLVCTPVLCALIAIYPSLKASERPVAEVLRLA
jgi:lipoprotein-releasing system permease protein